ncbi:MAG: VanZ family protein [Burkholderiaceae bacterium]
MPVDPTDRRSRLPEVLLGGYLLALVYGTLYPFSGWRSFGLSGLEFVLEPWPRYWTAFDLGVNVAVYALPGALAATLLRRRFPALASGLIAVAAAGALSFVLEALQSFIPDRVASRADWLANTAGALAGALGALALRPPRRWGDRRWYRDARATHDGAVGLALIAAWLAVQAHPQRLLFGTGDVLEPVLGLAAAVAPALFDAPEDTGGAAAAERAHALAGSLRLGADLTVFAEAIGAASAMLAIGLIVRELYPVGARRNVITGAAILSAALIRSAAAALLLGPGQAFAWLSAGAQGGLVVGAVLIALMASARRRARLTIAILALLVTALLTSVFPVDAYHASMLARWDQGAWRNFNGLLRGLSVAWPFAALAWCVARRRALRP